MLQDEKTQETSGKSVGAGLGIGILLLPIVFAWFTLRKGYSKFARVLSLGWMVLGVIILGSASNQTKSTPDYGTELNTPLEIVSEEQVETVEPPVVAQEAVMDDAFKESMMHAIDCAVGAGNFPQWINSLGTPMGEKDIQSVERAEERGQLHQAKVGELLSYSVEKGFNDEAAEFAKSYQTELLKRNDPNGDKESVQSFLLLVMGSVSDKCEI